MCSQFVAIEPNFRIRKDRRHLEILSTCNTLPLCTYNICTTTEMNDASSNLSCSLDGGVANPAGEKSKPGECPNKCEDPEAGVAGLRPSGVAQELCHLQPVVREVVDDEDQGAHPVHVVAPAEGEEGQGGHVVDEHLPEVLDAHQFRRPLRFLPFVSHQRTG